MKKNLLATLGILGASFCSAHAADVPAKKTSEPTQYHQATGFIGLEFGALHWNFDRNSGTAAAFSGTAKGNFWLNPGMSLQLDLDADATSGIYSFGGSSGKGGKASGQGGGHLAFRNSEYALGMFAGLNSANILDYWGQSFNGTIGFEAQKYFSNVTLYAQAGFAGRITGRGYYEPESLGFGRIIGRYFLTENDKIQLGFGYAKGTPYLERNQSAPDLTLMNWGASFEHRYTKSPLSVTASYEGNRYGSTFTATDHTLKIGVRLYFDNGSLLSTDRNGATFEMPNWHKVLPWSYPAATGSTLPPI